MNILQLAPRVPYPLHDGGAIGIFNITKHLALRGHRIRLVALSSAIPQHYEELERYCSLRIVEAKTGHSPWKLLRSWFSGRPYTIEKYHNRQLYEILIDECRRVSYDVVHADHLVMAPYAIALRRHFHLPIVLRQHNLETMFLKRFSEQQRNIALRLVSIMEARRMRSYESGITRAFDCCAMITPADERMLRDFAPGVKTAVIPAGVDPVQLSDLSIQGGGEIILFLASLDWQPNLDGLAWFVREVLPIIITRHPGVRLNIVGKGTAGILSRLGNPHINVVGYVADVSPYLQEAQICIVPLFTGSGMRVKILEMLAHGKAVVSTSIGCEGIAVVDGVHLRVADEPASFADAILILLAQPELRHRMGREGKQLVERNYRWSEVARQFESVYLEVCTTKRTLTDQM